MIELIINNNLRIIIIKKDNNNNKIKSCSLEHKELFHIVSAYFRSRALHRRNNQQVNRSKHNPIPEQRPYSRIQPSILCIRINSTEHNTVIEEEHIQR